MIFLTGGSGLLGLHLIDEFRTRSQRVLALARTPASATELRRRGATTALGDVAEPGLWEAIDGIEAIVHSAAIIISGAGWEDYQRTNVTATRLAARRARELGVPLIHISSIAVYDEDSGGQPPGSVTERYPIGSRTGGPLYARSKRLAEDMVWEEVERGLRAAVLRPCVVYGEGDRLFLPQVVRYARRGVFPLVGSGQVPLPLVHARNVASAVAGALALGSGYGQAFNVTNDGELTGMGFVTGLATGLGTPVRALRIPTPLALGGAAIADTLRGAFGRTFPSFRSAVRFLQGGNPFSSEAARSVLGWTPTVRHADAWPRAVRDSLRKQ